jgi:hypothetical protein
MATKKKTTLAKAAVARLKKRAAVAPKRTSLGGLSHADTVLALDPGLRACGWAVFEELRLVTCGCARTKGSATGPEQWRKMAVEMHKASLCCTPDGLAVEYMQTRKGMSAAHDNLIQLTWVSGLLAGYLDTELLAVPANDWTGGRKKEANHPVIESFLDASELAVLRKGMASTIKGHHKEVLDAVGIGLWAVGRFTQHRGKA